MAGPLLRIAGAYAARRIAGSQSTEVLFSTAIGEVEYNELEEELSITFKDGSTYTYEDVPYDVYSNLLSAGSAGAYFNANIRNEYSFR